MYKTKIIYILLLVHWGWHTLYGQNLKGTIQNHNGQGIANTNLIATPQTEDEDTKFAISDEQGHYKLSLKAEISYIIDITALGYSPEQDSLSLSKNMEKDYLLEESTESLEEVKLEAKMAIVVNEDTTTYDTDQFKTGDERKLRGILEKLPGVEVDHNGIVKVNGKKVDKLMVDGEDFFGGSDTKLGVDNIPADAVDEVQVIDDYNEVPFMKDLSDSDKMALNVKLKKDKNRFVFGENEVGGGVKKRYHLRPTLFYYTPNTTVNFIGSLNNVNESPLSFSDASRFQGGSDNYIKDPIESGDQGVTRFSNQEDLQYNKTIFGAANWTQKFGESLKLEAYSIAAGEQSEKREMSSIDYLTQNKFTEARERQENDKNFANYNKAKLRYTPNPHTDMAYDFIANLSKQSQDNLLQSQIKDSINNTQTTTEPRQMEISQYFRYNAQPTYAHTSELNAQYTYKKNDNSTDWLFDKPVFSDIIPFEEEGKQYNILQDYSSITNQGRIDYKHYWVLNNTNHIYPMAGFYFFNQSYNTKDYQRLQEGTTNDFNAAGFDNALRFQLLDPYIGFQYKVKIGETILRPGIIYHHYFWRATQFDDRITQQNKGVFLPEFRGEYSPKSTSKLILKYQLRSTFADAQNYANRLNLVNFNALYQGNEKLENSLYHDLSANFRSFDVVNRLNYTVNLAYMRREKSVRQTTTLEGIDQISTSIYTDFPENNYNVNGSISRRWTNFKLSLNGGTGWADYTRLINDQELDYKNQNYSYSLSGTTYFKDYPNLALGIEQNFRISKSEEHTNNYSTFAPYIRLDYAFGNGFILKADYRYTYSKEKTSNQSDKFQMGNASLYYSPKKSSWGLEVRAKNIFDLNYKRSHSFDQFMVYDQRTFIQPRTILFILSYQL